MTADAYATVIRAPARDRLDLFLATANRLGTPVGNVEKDFWVCWTLDALYQRLPADRPRLLFKGGCHFQKTTAPIDEVKRQVCRPLLTAKCQKSSAPISTMLNTRVHQSEV